MAADGTALNRAAYDQIAARYAERQRLNAVAQGQAGGWYGSLEADFLAGLGPASVLADLGCGPAHDGARLARAGYRVVGLDLSAGMLAEATASLGRGRVVQADLRALPLREGCLDGIWCAASLLHVPLEDTDVVLHGFRRVLRPGGRLALVTALGSGARLEPVPYAPEVERWFVYRTASDVRASLEHAGFHLLDESTVSNNREWLLLLAAVPDIARPNG